MLYICTAHTCVCMAVYELKKSFFSAFEFFDDFFIFLAKISRLYKFVIIDMSSYTVPLKSHSFISFIL